MTITRDFRRIRVNVLLNDEQFAEVRATCLVDGYSSKGAYVEFLMRTFADADHDYAMDFDAVNLFSCTLPAFRADELRTTAAERFFPSVSAYVRSMHEAYMAADKGKARLRTLDVGPIPKRGRTRLWRPTAPQSLQLAAKAADEGVDVATLLHRHGLLSDDVI